MCDIKSVQWLVIISVSLCYQLVYGENNNFNKLLKQRGNIAQCRASCLRKFVNVPTTTTRTHPIKFNYSGDEDKDNFNAGCTTKINWKCTMCWDYCESLALYEHTRAQMCNDDICLEGCQQACNFHNLQETQPFILPSTSSDNPFTGLKLHDPKVTKSGVVIAWTSISPSNKRKLTYVVLGLQQSHKVPVWEEIQQTAENQIILPLEAPKYEEINVAAFDQDGFLFKDNKKLVFQLRSKRSVESPLKKAKDPFFTTKQIVVSFLLLFICSTLLALVLRKFYCQRKEVKTPAIWV